MATTPEMDALAVRLGLTIIEAHGQHLGGYLPDDHAVRITPLLRRRVRRSVLAHEIAHHLLGHTPTPFGPVRKRQETEANRWAAERLITPAAYADAERRRDGHVESMAYDLDVVPELVMIYRSMLLRTDHYTYVHPRMGAGQWDARVELV